VHLSVDAMQIVEDFAKERESYDVSMDGFRGRRRGRRCLMKLEWLAGIIVGLKGANECSPIDDDFRILITNFANVLEKLTDISGDVGRAVGSEVSVVLLVKLIVMTEAASERCELLEAIEDGVAGLIAESANAPAASSWIRSESE
jgi:hypothetical protein